MKGSKVEPDFGFDPEPIIEGEKRLPWDKM
jgi:hypothetical protein